MNRIMVDHKKCTGCRICELVCSTRMVLDGFNPKAAALKVAEVGLLQADVPVVCMHCFGQNGQGKAPCSAACPTDAFVTDSTTGALRLIREKCIGCGACVRDCPFGVLSLHPETNTPSKCDLCDGQPLCVAHCPTGALSFKSETLGGWLKREEWVQKVVSKGGEKN